MSKTVSRAAVIAGLLTPLRDLDRGHVDHRIRLCHLILRAHRASFRRLRARKNFEMRLTTRTKKSRMAPAAQACVWYDGSGCSAYWKMVSGSDWTGCLRIPRHRLSPRARR